MNIIKKIFKKENLNEQWRDYFKSRLPKPEAEILMQKNELLRKEAYRYSNLTSDEYISLVAKIRKNDYDLSNYSVLSSENSHKKYTNSSLLRICK